MSCPPLGSLLGVDAPLPSVSDSGSVLEFGVVASLFTAGARRNRMEMFSSWGMMREMKVIKWCCVLQRQLEGGVGKWEYISPTPNKPASILR